MKKFIIFGIGIGFIIFLFIICFSKANKMSEEELEKLINKSKNYSNYTYTYEYKSKNRTDHFTYYKKLVKDEIEITIYKDEKDYYIYYYNNKENTKIVIDNNKKEYTETSNRHIMFPELNVKYLSSRLKRIKKQGYSVLNGSKVYYIQTSTDKNKNYTKEYIDLETGFLLKTEFFNEEDKTKNEVHEYNIAVDNVTIQDIEKPDLKGYKFTRY